MPEALFVLAVIAIIVLLIIIMKSYIKAPPDTMIVISGLRKHPRFAVGRSTMKIPLLERKDTLTLKVIDVGIETSEPVPTSDFQSVNVRATVNAKIPYDDTEMMLSASQNFLNLTPDEIADIIRPVLEGNVREIVGTMPLENMVSNRSEFAEKVKNSAEPDMKALGLEIKTFNLQNFTDENGVIKALGIENETRIKRDAAVAKAANAKTIRVETAKASNEASEAEVAAKTAIAERENQLRITRATLKQESDAKQAEADIAYSINQETQRRALEEATVNAEIARANREVELKKTQVIAEEERLRAEINKKADAEKYARQQEADAQLYAEQRRAEAQKVATERAAEAAAFKMEKEAQARKLAAEADLYEKTKQAEAIRLAGESEASAIKDKGNAEAEATLKKAEAMQKYGQAAILEMIVKALPEIANACAKPMESIDSVKIIGGDGSCVSSMSDNVPLMMSKVMESVKEATGIDIADIVRADGEHAQITRDINVTVNGDKQEAVKSALDSGVIDDIAKTAVLSDMIDKQLPNAIEDDDSSETE